ncbi:MAG TPA: nickel-binding protein [Gillisia sp.]|nr:nickel-binding protein [Gillisia sp.]
MPLFMDLHIVKGITAKGVAEAHVLDLNVQAEFKCSCITYWIDEANNSAFCLIEAPNETAVRELHKKSHGLLPHHIIQVNQQTVTSFLGRLYDPEVPGFQENQLKIFNDPAYRNLVLIDIADPVLLENRYSQEKIRSLLQRFHEKIKVNSSRLEGEIAEQGEDITAILCFASSTKALTCALEIANAFTREEKEILGLKISLNSGMPVSSSEKIFGETIELGKWLLYTSISSKIVVSTNVRDIERRELFATWAAQRTSLSRAEEKILITIFNVLELHCIDENFGIEEFCREAGFSKSSLNRHIRALTIISPNALLKQYRMNKALNLLRKGENIANVAFLAGFRSPSYFSKCFREHFFLSPSKYCEKVKSYPIL